MHQIATPSNQESVATAAKIDIEQHKFVRKIVSLIIVAGAVIITLYVWGIIERRPRTDDATARANVVGIAPRVSGQILKLNVQDNQAVKEGDVLFEIDPEDYRLILEKAKAELATLDRHLAQPGTTPAPWLYDRRRCRQSPNRSNNPTSSARRCDRDHQSRGTPSFLLQGHRTFYRTGHQSQHFGRRPCYRRRSRLLVARHGQMVRRREFSGGGDSTHGAGQRSDRLSFVRAESTISREGA